MSGRSASVLSAYNPLTDPHLAAHYSNRRRRKQLKSAGLIKRNGEIINEREWLLHNQNKEARSHMKDLLAQAVVQKALEIERNRQVDIRNQLEMMAKKERVRRIRAERSKTELVMKPIKVTSGAPRGRSAQNSRSSRQGSEEPEKAEAGKNRKAKQSKKLQKIHELDYSTLKMIKKEVDRNRAFHPTPSPFHPVIDTNPKKISNLPNLSDHQLVRSNTSLMHANAKSSGSRLHRPEPGMIVKVRQQTLCEMKYKYIGRPGIGETAYLDPEDVVIEQQHCGGETIKVYHGLLLPGQKIQFTSRRHRGYPYSIVMYVNNIRIERISSCCEYKNKKGARLGTGTLQFLSVEGAAPCFKCNVRKGLIKDKPEPAPRPVSRNDSKVDSQSAPRSHQSKDEEPNDDQTDQEEEQGETRDHNSAQTDDSESEDDDHDEKSLTDDSSEDSESDEENQNDSASSEPVVSKPDDDISSKIDDVTEITSDDAIKNDVTTKNVEDTVTQMEEVSKTDDVIETDAVKKSDDVTITDEDDVIIENDGEATLDVVTEKSDMVTDPYSARTEDDVTNYDESNNDVTTVSDDVKDDETANSTSSSSSSESEGDENETITQSITREDVASSQSLTTPTANLLVDGILERVQAAGDISPVSTTSPIANQLVADTIEKVTSGNTDSFSD